MREASLSNYEVTFILGEATTPEQGAAKVTEVTKLIADLGGKTEKHEAWGKRELAYPIKHNRTGFYATLWFELPTSAVRKLEDALRFDESVIRSLVTKAYTSAQPGSLYPVAEEEKPAKARRTETEGGSAEEELRRHATPAKGKKAKADDEDVEAELSEEDRLKQLDQAVDELLKDEADS